MVLSAYLSPSPCWLTCGRTAPKGTDELDLGMHSNVRSLLWGNYLYALGQHTVHYLARRSKTITKSIAMIVKTMTSIFVCPNINRIRRMDVLPDQGRVSKIILPRKTGLFKIAQCKVLGRRPLSLLPHNQVEHRADDCGFALGGDRATTKSYCAVPGASAYLPDVPLQCSGNIDVALTVRECVRVLESDKHAN